MFRIPHIDCFLDWVTWMEYSLKEKKQKDSILKHFEGSAVVYSKNREQDYSFIVQKRIVLSLLPEISGRILDIGCGGGYMAPDLLRKGFKVYGLDRSKKMISLAQDRVRKAGFNSNAYFLVGDTENLPFPSTWFDVIIYMGVMEYLSDNTITLQEMHRVLKPNGIVIITTPSMISPHCLLHSTLSFTYGHIRSLLGLKDLTIYKVKYTIPWRFEKTMTKIGFQKIESQYCNFVFYPLDKFFPRFSIALSKKMERFSRSKRLGWLGRQYILKVRKSQELGEH